MADQMCVEKLADGGKIKLDRQELPLKLRPSARENGLQQQNGLFLVDNGFSNAAL